MKRSAIALVGALLATPAWALPAETKSGYVACRFWTVREALDYNP